MNISFENFENDSQLSTKISCNSFNSFKRNYKFESRKNRKSISISSGNSFLNNRLKTTEDNYYVKRKPKKVKFRKSKNYS